MNYSHKKDDDKMKFCRVTVGEIDKKPYAHHNFIHIYENRRMDYNKQSTIRILWYSNFC